MTYQTIQVVPVEEIKPIFDKLMLEIEGLKKELLNKPDDTALDDTAAAAMANVSIPTLRRMKKDGRIKSLGTARGRVVRVCDVQEYLERKK